MSLGFSLTTTSEMLDGRSWFSSFLSTLLRMPLEMAPIKKETMKASLLYVRQAKNKMATTIEVVEPIHKTTLFHDDDDDSSLEDSFVDICNKVGEDRVVEKRESDDDDDARATGQRGSCCADDCAKRPNGLLKGFCDNGNPAMNSVSRIRRR
jgi:hypothetical protein